MPVAANVAALPSTAGLVHAESVYSLTVDPASDVPLTNGALDMPGEPGTVLITVGGPAGTVSMVTDSDPTPLVSGTRPVSLAVITCGPLMREVVGVSE